MKVNFSKISQVKASCEKLKDIKMSIKTAYKLSKLSNLLDNEIASLKKARGNFQEYQESISSLTV